MRGSLAAIVLALFTLALICGPLSNGDGSGAAAFEQEEAKAIEPHQEPIEPPGGAEAPNQELIEPPAEIDTPQLAPRASSRSTDKSKPARGSDVGFQRRSLTSLSQPTETGVLPQIPEPQPPVAPTTTNPPSDDPCAGLTAEQRKTIPMCNERLHN
jgi:hypothetical protein